MSDNTQTGNPCDGGHERHRAIVAAALEGIVVTDNGGHIVEVNDAACALLGRQRAELLAMNISAFARPERQIRMVEIIAGEAPGWSHSMRVPVTRADGTSFHADILAQVLPNGERLALIRDASTAVELERLQDEARSIAERRASAGAALSAASAAVLRCADFPSAAHIIYGACKGFIGAEAGCVSLTNDDEGDTILLADASGVMPSMSTPFVMPLDPLRSHAYETRSVVCENNLAASEFASLLPSGHAKLRNVLTAPLVIKDRVVGMLSLLNKPGGFDETDVEYAAAFGEIMAAALSSIRLRTDLESAARMQRLLFEGARDAIFWADGQTHLILDCNRAAEELMGRSRDELLGLHQSTLHPSEETDSYSSAFDDAVNEILSEPMAAVIVRGDGKRVHVEISTSVVDVRGRRIIQGLFRDVTQRNLALEELERHRRRLSELTAEILRTDERERRKAAVALHDGVGQSLAAAKFLTQRLAEACAEGADGELGQLLRLLDDSISHVRGLTNELSPPVLYELGLSAALSWLADSYANRFGLECSLLVDPELVGLKGESSSVAFRVVRELLMNVHRHAGAGVASVSATLLEDTIVLRVEDHGVGFDPLVMTADERGNRFGLFSIREEVRLIGGTIEIDSAPGRGARIDVRIPVDGMTELLDGNQ